jgi:uncharacterized protein YbjT (DUF2867 family)
MKVIIFGASGLVGGFLIEELVNSKEITEIKSFGRKEIALIDSKLIQYKIDFENIEAFQDLLEADLLFICLGSTIAKAGSKKHFRKIDYQYPAEISKLASVKGVKKVIAVSSIGANLKSGNFYLKTKGEMEQSLFDSGIPIVIIVRPSLLLGPRKEFRFGEKVGGFLAGVLNGLMIGRLKKYKAIEAQKVAKSMLYLALNEEDSSIKNSDVLEEIVIKNDL